MLGVPISGTFPTAWQAESMRDDTAPDLRISGVVVAVTGVAFVVLAVVLVPWDWYPGGKVAAVPAASVFTAAEIDRAEEFAWLVRLSGWGNIALGLLVSLWLGLTSSGARLVGRIPGPWVVKVAGGVGLVTLVGTLAALPLAARAHGLRRDADLSRQAWSGWLTDQAVSFLTLWVFTGIGVLAVLALVRCAPRTWPAWAATAAAALTMLGSFVYPVVVEPLSNDFSSMPAGPLRSDILALADAEGVRVDDVLVADASRRTTTLNAYVSGFGSTRRVVVYDTVLESLSEPEITMIVAHELGHAKHHDVLLGTTLGAVGAAFGVGLLGLVLRGRLLRRVGAPDAGDPRVVPLVLALAAVAALVASPVENTLSRAIEARADRASLAATGDLSTFTAMQRQLALRALSDPTPPRISQFWFGSHPTVLQRIGLAELVVRGSAAD